MSTSTRRLTPFCTTHSLPYQPQVLALALFASASTCAHAQEPTQEPTPAKSRRVEVVNPAASASVAGEAATSTVSWPSEARVSLELRRVPLTTFLSVLSAQTGVKFRLAAIPDVEVSVSLQNAPLQQAVRDLLALKGFELRPGPDAFWLVTAPPLASSTSATAQNSKDSLASRGSARFGSFEGWRWWTSAQEPPPRWMVPNDEEQIAYEGVPSVSGVPGLAPFGVRVRMQSSPLYFARWKSSASRFQNTTPGVAPVPAASMSPAASGSELPVPNAASAEDAGEAQVRWCARWPIDLRAVPERCLLVIESERPANLYVNGARLLRSWSGKRTLDVSGALSKGQNLLAIEWLRPEDAAAASPRLSSAPPVVRYEWLVAQ